MNRSTILDTARDAVTKDRAATHGGAEQSFSQIAALWSTRLGMTVTPAQVAIMMIDLKTVRAWSNPTHADSWVDVAGYAACGGEIATASVRETAISGALISPSVLSGRAADYQYGDKVLKVNEFATKPRGQAL